MGSILILKTGALGDVLRTTSILPGLAARTPGVSITWLTASSAVDLVRLHPLVERVVPLDISALDDPATLERARRELGATRFERVLSFDDEEPLCALAASLASDSLTGATLDAEGNRTYTRDAAPWFDMGLLSVHGKEAADRMKVENQRTHPELLAQVCGVEPGEPELNLTPEAETRGATFAAAESVHANGPVVGLNTGAGGRWTSKQLPVERTVELIRQLHAAHDGRVSFLVLGGPPERERNDAIVREASALGARVIDGGTDNALLDFAAKVDLCDVVVSSDSLAMHIAIARRRRVVAFFAPTSAAEIELYGRGEKVVSTAPDACSYRPDADNSSITPERVAAAVMRQLERVGAPGGSQA